MKTINKIILTSLITAGSFGIFGNVRGQTQDNSQNKDYLIEEGKKIK